MYNTKYECRYNKDEVFLDTDNVTEDEKDIVRDTLYREDLIYIFEIKKDDEFDIFNTKFTDLYNKLKDCLELRECMKTAAAKFISEDEETGLCILYSYDYMYVTHLCVSEYLDTGSISLDNIEKMNKILK